MMHLHRVHIATSKSPWGSQTACRRLALDRPLVLHPGGFNQEWRVMGYTAWQAMHNKSLRKRRLWAWQAPWGFSESTAAVQNEASHIGTAVCWRLAWSPFSPAVCVPWAQAQGFSRSSPWMLSHPGWLSNRKQLFIFFLPYPLSLKEPCGFLVSNAFLLITLVWVWANYNTKH